MGSREGRQERRKRQRREVRTKRTNEFDQTKEITGSDDATEWSHRHSAELCIINIKLDGGSVKGAWSIQRSTFNLTPTTL